MNWKRTLVRAGYIKEDSGEVPDPLAMLAFHAGATPAELEYQLRTGTDFSQSYCAVRLNIRCPQDERSINLAAEVVFRKALELVNDGASQIEVPLLPTFKEPQ